MESSSPPGTSLPAALAANRFLATLVLTRPVSSRPGGCTRGCTEHRASARPSQKRANSRTKCGGGGIRTHGELAPTAVFKTAAFDHSATPPDGETPTKIGRFTDRGAMVRSL